MLLTRARRHRAAVTLVAAMAGALAFVLLVTCNGDGGVAPTLDAGADAGGDDAGTRPDAERPSIPRDAGPRDAGLDGGRRDAGLCCRDAGLAEIRWERFPALPDYCTIDRALDPSELYRSRWEPCPGAQDFCQQLVSDWTFTRWWFRTAYGNQHTGEYGYWSLQPDYPGDGEPNVEVLATTAGPSLFAFRWSNHDCVMKPVSNDGDFALVASAGTRGSETRPRRMYFFMGSVDDASALDVPVAVIDVDETRVNVFQWPQLTHDLLVGGVQPGNFSFVVRRTGETRRIDRLRPASAMQELRLVGEHILWFEYGARWSLIHEAPDGSVEPYLELPDADIREWRSDGTTMVWVQSYPPGGGASYDRHEIWTAPYVRRPADLTGARLVRTVTDHRFPIIGQLHGNIFAFVWRPPDAPFSLDTVELATGERRRFVLPPYLEEINPHVLYLTDAEVMIIAGGSGIRPHGMRITLDRLPIVSP